MALTGWKKKALDGILKYKYALGILLIGLVLMWIPGQSDKGVNESAPVEKSAEEDISSQLARILSQIQGAGSVEVLLTVSSGEKILYQQDTDIAVGESGTDRQDTVVITDADRNQNGLIQQVIPPVYQGAVIVCSGADDPKVKLAIVEAVSRATGLGADRICVLKMK